MHRPGIQTKLLLALFFAAILPAVVFGFFLRMDLSDILLEILIENSQHDIDLKKEGVNNFLSSMIQDVDYLSNSNGLNALINNTDEEKTEGYRLALEEDYLSFSMARGVYYQVRYIDENGQETVRVDSIDGKHSPIKKESLQNKKTDTISQSHKN